MTRAEKYVREHLAAELEEVRRTPIAHVENGLTIYEKALIYHYTKDGSKQINSALKNGPSNVEAAHLLASALRKLPPYLGIVHRTNELLKKEIQSYRTLARTGDMKIVPEFLSSSKSPLIARMRPRFNVKYQILSRSGRSIEDISYMGKYTPPNEQEVLFLPGTRFTITNVTDLRDYLLIFMEEL